jgi:hypothetical protein
MIYVRRSQPAEAANNGPPCLGQTWGKPGDRRDVHRFFVPKMKFQWQSEPSDWSFPTKPLVISATPTFRVSMKEGSDEGKNR